MAGCSRFHSSLDGQELGGAAGAAAAAVESHAMIAHLGALPPARGDESLPPIVLIALPLPHETFNPTHRDGRTRYTAIESGAFIQGPFLRET
jgi:hypothetical protein